MNLGWLGKKKVNYYEGGSWVGDELQLSQMKMSVPWGGDGAEGDGVVAAAGAGEGAGGVVVCVAVRVGAGGLEELRVGGRAAGVGVGVGAAAAVLGPAEGVAGAAAPGAALGAQLRGAPLVEVRRAPGRGARRGTGTGTGAGGGAARGLHQDRQVVAVHQADVVEVVAAGGGQRELGQRRRRRRVLPVALQGPGPAVARRAHHLAAAVLPAAGAGPGAAGPPRRRRDRARRARRQHEARRVQPRASGVGLDARPHRPRAPVHERECRGSAFCKAGTRDDVSSPCLTRTEFSVVFKTTGLFTSDSEKRRDQNKDHEANSCSSHGLEASNNAALRGDWQWQLPIGTSKKQREGAVYNVSTVQVQASFSTVVTEEQDMRGR
jgi:hypothetical protein